MRGLLYLGFPLLLRKSAKEPISGFRPSLEGGGAHSLFASLSQALCRCTPGKDRRWSGDFECLHVFIYSFIHSVLRAYFVPGTMRALQIKL